MSASHSIAFIDASTKLVKSSIDCIHCTVMQDILCNCAHLLIANATLSPQKKEEFLSKEMLKLGLSVPGGSG